MENFDWGGEEQEGCELKGWDLQEVVQTHGDNSLGSRVARDHCSEAALGQGAAKAGVHSIEEPQHKRGFSVSFWKRSGHLVMRTRLRSV
eukprot:1187776-Prorocentrum_minimum.AAC.7